MILVGPPGAGKTTTLIKLAAQYALQARGPSQILTTDVYRIAAADQLVTLASILGIGCEIIDTPGALAQAIDAYQSKEYLFVDTPGLSRGDLPEFLGLSDLIAQLPLADTHLVLPAFMRGNDMLRAAQDFSVFRPRKLIFTRMDEAEHFDHLIEVSNVTGLPISFLASGQRIPDDLEPASRSRLNALAEDRQSVELSFGAAA